MSKPLPIETLNMLMRCLPDAPFKSRLAEEIVAYGQACRAAALEEAAMAAENGFKYALDGYQIADNIRSLK